MTIEVDKNLCIGCGLCASTCPHCFEIGDDGKSHPLKNECQDCNLLEVAAECPSGAITINE